MRFSRVCLAAAALAVMLGLATAAAARQTLLKRMIDHSQIIRLVVCAGLNISVFMLGAIAAQGKPYQAKRRYAGGPGLC